VRTVEKAIAADRRGEDVPEELDIASLGVITDEEWRAFWPSAELTALAGEFGVDEALDEAVDEAQAELDLDIAETVDTEPAPDRVPEPTPADVPEPGPVEVPEPAPVDVPEPSPEDAVNGTDPAEKAVEPK
jgi:XTP/dITP diphosphohydrolase